MNLREQLNLIFENEFVQRVDKQYDKISRAAAHKAEKDAANAKIKVYKNVLKWIDSNARRLCGSDQSCLIYVKKQRDTWVDEIKKQNPKP